MKMRLTEILCEDLLHTERFLIETLMRPEKYLCNTLHTWLKRVTNKLVANRLSCCSLKQQYDLYESAEGITFLHELADVLEFISCYIIFRTVIRDKADVLGEQIGHFINAFL